MNTHNNKTRLEPGLAILQRRPVPDTEVLQKRIIAQASQLPQSQRQPQRPSLVSRFIQSLRTVLQPQLKPLAIGCGAAVVGLVLLNLPQLGKFQSQQNDNTIVFDSASASAETMDQASWDELMLIQDELAFSDFLQ